MRRPPLLPLHIACRRPAGRARSMLLRRAGLVPALALLTSLSLATPSAADVTLDETGRRTATRPKLATAAIDGIPIALPDAAGDDRPAPGRRLGKKGRSLYARPTQPAVAGLVGCVGCREYLRVLGGVVVDGR